MKSIGLLPETGPFKGATPRERVLNYARGLKLEGSNFKLLQKLLDGKIYDEALELFWDMDTAVRDTFINAYTNNQRSERAIKELEEILEIQIRRKK